MSFGFSVGDFVVAAKLINDIVSALRSSSSNEYRELVVELHNLGRALNEIEHLQCVPEQVSAVAAVRVAALTCQFPLSEFATKLRKFECLLEQLPCGARQRVMIWKSKLEWGFTMEEEVQRLRTYLLAHVGSLNMRLITLGIAIQSTQNIAILKKQAALEDGLTATQAALHDVQINLDFQKSLINDNKIRLETLTSLVTKNVIPMLWQLPYRVWSSNMKLINFITWQQNDLPATQLNNRWQEMVKFEDARGRIFPIPSEFNWSKVHAIIQDEFRTGPGREKVSFGEYDLYDTTSRIRKITSLDHETLMPGRCITMAMRIGMYNFGLHTRCPNPGCKSNAVTASRDGGRKCSMCHVWHSITKEAPTQPFRLIEGNYPSKAAAMTSQATNSLEDAFKQVRIERMSFKNMQIHLTELSTLQSKFENNGKKINRRNRISVADQDEWSQSSITFECPSQSILSSANSSSHISMLPHKIINNYQQVPLSVSKYVLSLIADEVGLKVSELDSTTRFEDIGLDSLLSLSIVAQLGQAGLDLPTSIFWDFPTVQELEAFLDRS